MFDTKLADSSDNSEISANNFIYFLTGSVTVSNIAHAFLSNKMDGKSIRSQRPTDIVSEAFHASLVISN